MYFYRILYKRLADLPWMWLFSEERTHTPHINDSATSSSHYRRGRRKKTLGDRALLFFTRAHHRRIWEKSLEEKETQRVMQKNHRWRVGVSFFFYFTDLQQYSSFSSQRRRVVVPFLSSAITKSLFFLLKNSSKVLRPCRCFSNYPRRLLCSKKFWTHDLKVAHFNLYYWGF